jgi:hypothetical protein
MDVKKCDLCADIFEFHSVCYQPVELPDFTTQGGKKTNRWKDDVVGDHNTNKYDLCADCFDALRDWLTKPWENTPPEVTPDEDELYKLRAKAASAGTGTITVSIEELNAVQSLINEIDKHSI